MFGDLDIALIDLQNVYKANNGGVKSPKKEFRSQASRNSIDMTQEN